MSLPIARYLDHSLLKPTQTERDVRAECEMCRRVEAASACVKPMHVPLAAELLAGSNVNVSTVIGFPHGGTNTQTKVAEAEWVCQQGAVELDMVAMLPAVLVEDWQAVAADIGQIVKVANQHDAIVKVIFETGLLPSDDYKIRLCEICEGEGAAFVKTSTGFGYMPDEQGHLKPTGATEHDIRLMREHTSNRVQVKAAGGIRNLAHARKFIGLGATRLGTSSTEAIVAEEVAEY